MWKFGVIGVPQDNGPDVRVRYQVKVYQEGSVFGINEGRISKLCLQIGEEVVADYDRGWDVEPTCEAAEIALAILLESFK